MSIKTIFCCLKIKTATLIIGFGDLFLHILVLLAICSSITKLSMIDNYMKQLNNRYQEPLNINNQNQQQPLSNDLNEKYISKTFPSPSDENTNNDLKYQNTDFFMVNDIHILNKQDKSIAFLVTFCSALITLMLIYGVVKNRPSYLMPYFCIKVFHVIITTLTTLGFYSCLPNIKLWIRMHKYFPYKEYLLNLDKQTLDLTIFTTLLTVILIKLYIVIIVWYCYRYMITHESFTRGARIFNATEENLVKLDDEILLSPPKYEDVVANKVFNEQAIILTVSENEQSNAPSSSANNTNDSSTPPPPYIIVKTNSN